MNSVAIWLDNWQGGYCCVNLTGRTERTAAWLTLQRCVYQRPVDEGLAGFTCRSGRAPFPWLSVRTSLNIRLLTLPFPIAVSHWQAQSQRRHGRGVFPAGAGSIYTFPCSRSGKPQKRVRLSHYFTPWNVLKSLLLLVNIFQMFTFSFLFVFQPCPKTDLKTLINSSLRFKGGFGECALWNKKHPDIKLHEDQGQTIILQERWWILTKQRFDE